MPRKRTKKPPTPRALALRKRRERQTQLDAEAEQIKAARRHLGTESGPEHPQARYHYTTDDTVVQLIQARQNEPDIGFMNRVLSVCALPRRSRGKDQMYTRNSGDYKLTLSCTHADLGLPYGTYPRLIFAWICTEAVQTKTPRLMLGRSLSEFLDKVGVKSSNSGGRWGVRTQVVMQMRRLFACAIRIAVKRDHGVLRQDSEYAGIIAMRQELWWDPKDPLQQVLWNSFIELNHELFKEIVQHAVPLDMRTLRAIRRSPLGIDLYMWTTYRNHARRLYARPLKLSWRQLHQQFGGDPENTSVVAIANFRRDCIRELKRIRLAWPSLKYETPFKHFVLHPSPRQIETKTRTEAPRLPLGD